MQGSSAQGRRSHAAETSVLKVTLSVVSRTSIAKLERDWEGYFGELARLGGAENFLTIKWKRPTAVDQMESAQES